MVPIFRTSSVWREMDRLQREMNRLFNGYTPTGVHQAPSYPAINIWTSEDGQFVSAEMPGVRTEDIDVSVESGTLTISGRRGYDELPDNVRPHRRERSFGEFSRSIRLPFAVDTEHIEASFKDGVLNITLPRVEEDKPKKILIKS